MKKLLAALALLIAPAAAAQDIIEYYHHDAIGSVVAVTNQTGVVIEQRDYLPFGEEWCGTATCGAIPSGQPLRFTTKERDAETGLDYFGARYYRAGLARFTTIDPIYTWRENLLDPQRWNRYAYGRGNPLRYVDPDGREVVSVMDGKMYGLGTEIMAPATVADGNAAFAVLVSIASLGLPDPTDLALAPIAARLARPLAKLLGKADEITDVAQAGETRFTAAGRRAHAEEPLPPGFEREVQLPSGKRMDGYNAAERQVIELKPNNPRAVRRGERQVEGYCRECDEVYGAGHTGRVQTYDATKYLKEKN